MAARFGPSWWAVRDQAYHDTLAAYLSHLEMERIERLEREHDSLNEMRRTNLAIASKSTAPMQREISAHERRMRRKPRTTPSGEPKPITLDDYMDFPLIAERRKPVS